MNKEFLKKYASITIQLEQELKRFEILEKRLKTGNEDLKKLEIEYKECSDNIERLYKSLKELNDK